MCHMSVVTCHMSRVTCQVSQFFFFFFYKVLELVGGGSVIKGLLSIVKKNGSFSGAFLGAFDKYVENLCNFRELFQCFGSICKLYEEFFTNFENSTEILCYYLCCFQKTPEFRRFSKIWDPATALPWRCKILSTSRTQKTWCLVLFMLKKKKSFFLEHSTNHWVTKNFFIHEKLNRFSLLNSHVCENNVQTPENTCKNSII